MVANARSIEDSFILSHPELQPDLCLKIEPGAVPSHYINRYHADHDVACAFCAKQTPHRRGYTAAMPDGRVALIGRDCAREFFGKDKAISWEKALKAQEDRRARRRVITRTISVAPALLEKITVELVQHESEYLNVSEAIAKRTTGRMPQVRRRDNGDWELMSELPDSGITIAGAAILNGGDRRRRHLAKAREGLLALAEVDPSIDLSDLVVNRLLDIRKTALADIDAGLRQLKLCSRFYTHSNLKAFTSLLGAMDCPLTRVDIKVKQSREVIRLTERELRVAGWDDVVLRGPVRSTFPLPALGTLPNVDDIAALIGGDA